MQTQAILAKVGVQTGLPLNPFTPLRVFLMSRLVYGFVFAVCLASFSATIGCGSGSNEVIEETRTQAEIDAELEQIRQEEAAAEKAAAAKS